MSNMLKLAAVLVSLNIFMYVFVNFAKSSDGNELNEDLKFHWEGDLLDRYMQGTSLDNIVENTKDNWTDYSINFSSGISSIPDKQGGTSIGQGGISFLDALDIVWDFIKTLFNIVASPLTLFFNFRMPVIIGILIGIPYFIIFLITLFAFIRGVPD